MRKRMISVLLVLVIICSLFPKTIISVSAEEQGGACGSTLTWNLDTATGELTISGEGDMNFSIAPWSEYSKYDVKTVVIEEGVTSIAKNAFLDCYSMTSISMPNTIKSINAYAFASCRALEVIEIPAGVTFIAINAFTSCESLQRVVVDNQNSCYASDNSGVLFNKEMTRLIFCPATYSGVYTIPDGVETVGDSAFDAVSRLTEIVMPDSVISIGNGAFRNTGLCNIVLSNNLQSIGNGAFMDSNLKSVVIPDSVTNLGTNVFSGCESLFTVILPENLEMIPSQTFFRCKSLETIGITSSVQTIGPYAFCGCSRLTNALVPESVVSIERDAFQGCSSLTSISIENDECSIHQSVDTLGIQTETLIRGNDFSTAEEYANKFGYMFESLSCTHSWINENILIEPTCASNGLLKHTCSLCGLEKSEIIEAFGHSYVDHYCFTCGLVELKTFADVALNQLHTAAVTTDGELYLWGDNSHGQIGNGSTEKALKPVYVMGNIVKVELGIYFSAALSKDGDLYVWGSNEYGQIGNKKTGDQLTPYCVLSDVLDFSVGDSHIVAIVKNGDVYAWGSNKWGQVSTAPGEVNYTPELLMKFASEIEAEGERTAIINNDGQLFLYGENKYGEIGSSSWNNASFGCIQSLNGNPVRDVELSPGAGNVTAAISLGGALYRWGDATLIRGGYAYPTDEPQCIMYGVDQVSVGYTAEGCAITFDDELYVWRGSYPYYVMNNVQSCDMGDGHWAVLTNDGELYCWGENNSGQVGVYSEPDIWVNGDTGELVYYYHVDEPMEVLNNVVSVSTDLRRTAAIDDKGMLFVWGENHYGQVGNGTATEPQFTPYQVSIPYTTDYADNDVVFNQNANLYVYIGDSQIYDIFSADTLLTGEFSANFNSERISAEDVTWSSSDETVLKILDVNTMNSMLTLEVEGLSEGTVTLTAAVEGGVTLSTDVTVVKPNILEYTAVYDSEIYYSDGAIYSETSAISDCVELYLELKNKISDSVLCRVDESQKKNIPSISDITLTATISDGNLSFDKNFYQNSYTTTWEELCFGETVRELLMLFPNNFNPGTAVTDYTINISVQSKSFDEITEFYHFSLKDIVEERIDEHLDFVLTNPDYLLSKNNYYGNAMIALKDDWEYKWSKYSTFDFENYYEVVMADIMVSVLGVRQTQVPSLMPEMMKEWLNNYQVLRDGISSVVEDDFGGLSHPSRTEIDKLLKMSKYSEDGIYADDEIYQTVLDVFGTAKNAQTIQNIFAALDKTQQVYGFVELGSDILKDAVHWGNMITIFNTYEEADQAFKEVLQKFADSIPYSESKMREAVYDYINYSADLDGEISELLESFSKMMGNVTWDVFDSFLGENLIEYLGAELVSWIGSFKSTSGVLLSSTSAFTTIQTYLGSFTTGISLGLCLSDILCNSSGKSEEMSKVVAMSEYSNYILNTLLYFEEGMLSNQTEESVAEFEYAFLLNKAVQSFIMQHTVNALEAKRDSVIMRLFGRDDYDGLIADVLAQKLSIDLLKCHREDEEHSTVVSETKVLAIRCPVDVAIADRKGETIVHISAEIINHVSENVIVFVDNQEKYIALPTNEDYYIQVNAYDSGTMEYVIFEYEDGACWGRTLRAVNIPLEQESMFTGTLVAEMNADEERYALSFDGLEYVPELDSTANVSVSVGVYGNGSVTGNAVVSYGEDASISAIPDADECFLGWYVNDELFSADAECCFPTTSNTHLVAYFTINGELPVTPTAEGECTSGITWHYSDKLDLMYIKGIGDIPDYKQFGEDVPWKNGEGLQYSFSALVIAKGITSIGEYAFSWRENLYNVSLPDSLIEIGNGAFSLCTGLKRMVIPEKVSKIESGAFLFCDALEIVTVLNPNCTIDESKYTLGNTNITVINGYGGSTAQIYAERYGYAFEEVLSPFEIVSGKCGADLSWYFYSQSGILRIIGSGEMDQFDSEVPPWNNYLQDILSVDLGSNVRSIGDGAFRGSQSLSNISFGDSVSIIGSGSFENCTNLKTVSIIKEVTQIGDSAFAGCDALERLFILSDEINIGENALGNPEKTSLYAYADTGVQEYAEAGEYHFSTIMGTCGNNVFWALDSDNALTVFGKGAMSNATYQSRHTWYSYRNTVQRINLLDGVTTIGNYAFCDFAALESVTFAEGLTTIGTCAFTNAESLLQVKIPSSVTSIGGSAFNECNAMEGVYITDMYAWCRISYPDGSVGANPLEMAHKLYLNGKLVEHLQVPTGIKKLGYAAFSGGSCIKTVSLPHGLQEIGRNAFSGCLITSIEIPNSVEIIGTRAFERCHLECIVLPESISKLDWRALDNLSSLKYVVIMNPDCDIYDEELTLSGSFGITVYGLEGSTAQRYSEKYEYNFVLYDCEKGIHCAYEAARMEPTCISVGEIEYRCLSCGVSYQQVYATELGHLWGDGIVTREPTEDEPGERTYTCRRCGDTKTEEEPFDNHVHSYVITENDATCTQPGYAVYTCECGDSYKTPQNPLGHNFGDWIVLKEPTTTGDGLEERRCARCGHTEQHTIAKLENPFNDVAPGSFYYEPVMWAVEKDITNGTSATTFSPNDQCMRAQVVTFLWRAVGSPEPTRTDNPFVDVKPTDFYYKPVLWAVENGITSGMDATHFGPTAYCNRAQVVTFLYRTMGNPDVGAATNPFTDVAVGSFYEKPVLWAVENGVTAGMSATSFGPNSICNRAQIVTFLYRAFVD